MIELNLLPDVKVNYLKVRRLQHLIISVSILLTIASLVVLILLVGTVDLVQKKSLSDLDNDITRYTHQLQATPNLNKILTVQNQLQVLTNLHNQKPDTTRLFGYLAQLTPSSVTISQLSVDFAKQTIAITGSAQAVEPINTFADTLKFTTYNKSGGVSANAFSAVTLSQSTRSSAGATYTITANFAPEIFDATNKTSLTVPNKITTRSITEQPLFQAVDNPGGQ